MHRNKSVSTHQFAMIPKFDVPRSAFVRESTHKTTIDSGFLYPIYVDEVLPADTFNYSATMFGRLSTPLVPIMDNLTLDSFFFFVPNRLVWDNWVRFMGEQDNPSDSISYVIPQLVSPAGGYATLTIYDYMGLPTVGQVTGGLTVTNSVLPLRAYNLIWNDWFRDENLQNSVQENRNDGPDSVTNFTLLRRGKRKDYFTGALPWPQKGSAVLLPLGTKAPISGLGLSTATGFAVAGSTVKDATTSNTGVVYPNAASTAAVSLIMRGTGSGATAVPDVYADLSQATAATVNQLRQSFQIQKLLERDARGGSRYTELVRSHFGVASPDSRLQRPEYIGGGSTPISINPIAQTQATGASGTTTPLGQLGAMGTLLARNHGFSYSAVEHGHIIGLVSIRADLTYQQGMRKMWSRSTRYDFYWPEFAMLGEQAILNKEIYATGNTTQDNLVFGYQERWAEYRYFPSMITGYFKSTTVTPIDIWHLAQKFTALPTLNDTFIQDNPPVSRVIAVGAAGNGQQFLLDIFQKIRTVRAMPLYSVPGLIDHF